MLGYGGAVRGRRREGGGWALEGHVCVCVGGGGGGGGGGLEGQVVGGGKGREGQVVGRGGGDK